MRELPAGFSESDPTRAAWLARSALTQAEAIRNGETTSAALTELYLDRIARHDGRVGAFVDLCAEAARREAAARDRARAAGGDLPPFHGVPVGVKDLHFARGLYNRLGSRAYRYLYSPFDDLTVRALRRAGFVVLGKTSTSELALLPIVEPDIHPPTRNPWDLRRSAGGSSGGAAAAVAAGLLPIAPGSDGAGSVRIPAALCGLVGLKPSRGAIPTPHAGIDRQGLTAIGPIARTIDDAAALADALREPKSRAAASWLQLARRPPPRGLRVGLLLSDALGGGVGAEQAAATRSVAERLQALGCTVTSLAPVEVALGEFLPIYQKIFARTPVLLPSKLQAVTRWFRDEGGRLREADVQRAFDRLCTTAEAAMASVDLVLSPTVGRGPPEVGSFAHLPPAALFSAAAPIGAFTAPWNLTGRPALTLPWGRDSEGLPLGVQLGGRHGDDALLLALGRLLEAEAP